MNIIKILINPKGRKWIKSNTLNLLAPEIRYFTYKYKKDGNDSAIIAPRPIISESTWSWKPLCTSFRIKKHITNTNHTESNLSVMFNGRFVKTMIMAANSVCAILICIKASSNVPVFFINLIKSFCKAKIRNYYEF